MAKLASEFALGIDPGLKGAIVLIQRRPKGFSLAYVSPMPLTDDESTVAVKTFIRTIGTVGASIITVEQAVACAFVFGGGKGNAPRRQSVASGFSCGQNFGRITAALDLTGTKYRLVSPRTWTAELHKGFTGKSKEKSLKAFATLCSPTTKAMAVLPGCRVVHDGIVDAALIAYWGMLNV